MMGELIDLDEYRERRALERQVHDWTDEQLALLLYDILYLDMISELQDEEETED